MAVAKKTVAAIRISGVHGCSGAEAPFVRALCAQMVGTLADGDIAERYELGCCWCDAQWHEFRYRVSYDSGTPVLEQHSVISASTSEEPVLPQRLPLTGATVKLTTPEIINISLYSGEKLALRSDGIVSLLKKVQKAIADADAARYESDEEQASVRDSADSMLAGHAPEGEVRLRVGEGSEATLPAIQGCAVVLWHYASSRDEEHTSAVKVKRTGSQGYAVLSQAYRSDAAKEGWEGPDWTESAFEGETDPMRQSLQAIFQWRRPRCRACASERGCGERRARAVSEGARALLLCVWRARALRHNI